MTSTNTEHGEHVVKVTDEHWVKYVVPVLISIFLFAIAFLLFVLAGITAHHYMWLSHASYIAALLLFLVTLHWFFMVLLSEGLDKIIITNRRLMRVQYRIIFHEDILEISFDKMKTVDARKHGFIQNILHYGTLIFEVNKARVPLVPHPNRIAKIIQDAMQEKH
ncbi:MAG: hypothetical protein Q7R81_03735 [Candidatus Peregrinibacteria bacterium]|nr:hypothetical protein [Candidatus Peregrinibacteria bacterium]